MFFGILFVFFFVFGVYFILLLLFDVFFVEIKRNYTFSFFVPYG